MNERLCALLSMLISGTLVALGAHYANPIEWGLAVVAGLLAIGFMLRSECNR